MVALTSSQISALLSIGAAFVIVVATFWQWWDITADGMMPMRRWVRPMLLAVVLMLVASAIYAFVDE